MKYKFVYLFIICLSIVLFSLTLRGNAGVPTVDQIEASHKSNQGAFESSQESSRYAMILSMYYDKTVILDKYPFLGTPDLGYLHGHFYSFFPPTLSFFAVPFYKLGLLINAAQLSVFAMLSIFSIMVMSLIIKFGQKLNLHWSSALFSAIAFGFATNAWGYSVTLYVHVVSAFLILSAVYLTVFWREKMNFLRLHLFWLLYGLAIYFDYPNMFTFLPIALVITFQGVSIQKDSDKIKISLNWEHFFAPWVFFAMMAGLAYYNSYNFGNPIQMSNTLPRVNDINKIISQTTEKSKGSVPALQTRSLLVGFNSFIFSQDRGLLVFTPIVALFILGINYLKNKGYLLLCLILTVAGINLLQYSMFGDPYGGWAYGSRYLIAILPLLCLAAGVGLEKFSKKLWIKILYSLVFIYSAAVSLLAPLTTNVLPPLVEAKPLGLDATYFTNIRLLESNHLDSFFYNYVIHQSIPGVAYYLIILTIVLTAGLTLIWWRRK